ncbi:DNA/RNA non-specific endonuclease [Treponema sp.]|uniref:DNA/RNA non-specific endonuclease n=1 Tax=Treponema sp. TaxID=166 RepID=UPI00298DBA3F|nr:DNA/RNA non-specific endonuclease [Treponema sp.]MCQ2240417.1 DNA/RNA non-specific endonuclease [Treponema sp.]
MKKFFLLLIAIFILIAMVWAVTNKDKITDRGDSPLKHDENTSEQRGQTPMDSKEIPSDFYAELNAIPVCKGNDSNPDNDSDHEIHTYSGFTLCYRESYEDAEWVAYILTREELKAVTGRSNDFRPDPSITTGSSDLSDYKKSGYDRGHLAPAADMEWSKESCSESFFMSNMTPQAPAFNRGMWQQLESQVRRWADRFGKIIVVTGPVLEKDADGYAKIGGNQVAVPQYFFKSILAQSEDGTAIAINFIMPNSKCEGTIWDYCVTADEIETRTGFDIFSFLPDSVEEKVESSVNIESWK